MSYTLPDTRPAIDAGRRIAFRPVLALLAGFVVVSVAMEAVLVVLSMTRAPVDSPVWVRCSLVLASAIVLLRFSVVAAGGSRPAWLRVRIISPVVVTAVVVVISIPGFLPGWVRVEQGLCGVLVLAVSVLVNLPRTQALFPRGE